MDDPSPDPKSRPPTSDKPRYLPRIVYSAPPGEAAAATTANAESTSPKGMAAKKQPTSDKNAPAEAEHKGVLKEATPELDTYEARRKIRRIVGGASIGILALTVFVIIQLLRGPESPDTGDVVDSPPTADPSRDPARREAASLQLLDEARQYAKKGQIDQATKRLERLISAFPSTTASQQARAALDRQTKRLPLFPEGEIITAKQADSEADDRARASTSGTDTIITAVAPKAGPGDSANALSTATAGPSAVVAEPYRETGLPRERAEVTPRELPGGFRIRAEAGVHPSGWPNEITCDRDGSAMVLVPSGPFIMGYNQGRPAERPEHEVVLSAYYIDQHEVTKRQFDLHRLAAGKLSDKVKPDASPAAESDSDQQPMTGVSLDDARAFARWSGRELPTEAQWEKAGRASDGRIYPWGNDKPQWESPRAPKQIDPVCSLDRDLSPYGVFDLAGNAWEWTSDGFEARAYQASRSQGNSKTQGKRVARIPEFSVRGGSNDWHLPWRSGMPADARLPYLGFRCVLIVEGASQTGPAQPRTTEPTKKQINTTPF